MTDGLLTSVVGSHAHPGWFASGIAAAERGEFGPADLAEMLDDAVDLAIRDQEVAGIDVVTDGEMRRAGEYTAARLRTTRPLKVTLPGPYTLSCRLRTGPGDIYETRVAAAEAFVPILQDELRRLANAGATIIQIDEPSPAIHLDAPADFVALFNAAIEPVRGRVRLGAHLCFGNFLGRPLAARSYAPIRDAMLGFAVDELVLEFANRDMAEVELVRELADAGRDVAAGVVDVKNYHLETADEVGDRIELILSTGVPPERLALVPDCGFSQPARWAAIPNSVPSSPAATSSGARSPQATPRAIPPVRTPADPPPQEENATMQAHLVTMLGTGLIGDFYTATLHGQRGRDHVRVVFSKTEERGRAFTERWSIPESTTDLKAAIEHPDTDVVVVGLPNYLHEEAVGLVAAAGKAVLCTKPLGRTADEARRMLETVEEAGVFGGYLEDLCYAPKTLKAVSSVQSGAIGDVTWVRSRETHPGPHSAWFWDGRLTGGGAIIDLGCHCIEIIRSFVGKGNRPVEVMCTTDTLVHPIDDEDNAIALIRFESGAIGQFEVSWTFRGGMDLRDEVAGTHGTIWLNHFLRTGFEMFTAGGGGGYVAEKAETAAGWLFPVGDEVSELGYVDMFSDMFDAMEGGRAPRETFYDGYVVNAVMDAAYRSAKSRAWEPVELFEWRGGATNRIAKTMESFDGQTVIKREVLPDGRTKLILKDPASGDFRDRIIAGS